MTGFQHATLTLDGTAQPLLDAFGDTTVGGADDFPAQVLTLQPDGGNTHVVYYGGAGVTTADYAFRQEAPTATIPPAPIIISLADGRLKPSQMYVIGTAGEKVHIGIKIF